MIINNKQVVSLGDLYDILKSISEYNSEFLYDTPLMMSIKENDTIKNYCIEQVSCVAEGTSKPMFHLRNYKEIDLHLYFNDNIVEKPYIPKQKNEDIINYIKGENQIDKIRNNFK